MPETRTLQLLHSVFGHAGFRPHQEDIVSQLVNGGDALVIMPTGGAFYYVCNSVSFRPVDISGMDGDLSQPTKPGRKKAFQLTPEMMGASQCSLLARRNG